MFNTKNKKGYTLIEILVVISIIGFIAAAAMYFLNSAREEGRIAGLLQFSDGVKSSLADNIVSYWSFNSGDGTDSWGQNHGNLNGLDSSDLVEGVVGDAFDFDGSSEFVDIGNSESLDFTSVMTVEAWVYGESLGDWATVLIRTSDWEDGYGMNYRVGSGNIIFWLSAYNGDVVSAPFSLGKWHHVVGVADGINVKLYVDGKKEDEIGYGGSIESASAQLFIGRGVGGYYWNGKIDEVKIYSEALSFTQIQKLYAEGAKKFQVAVK